MTAPRRMSAAEWEAHAVLQEVAEARDQLAAAELKLATVLGMQARAHTWMHRDSMLLRVLVEVRTFTRDLWHAELVRATGDAERLGLGPQ